MYLVNSLLCPDLSLEAMGSLKVQPPNGLTRNLTDVFQFLRQSSIQNRRCVTISSGTTDADDRVALLDEAEQGTAVAFRSGKGYTPSWVILSIKE